MRTILTNKSCTEIETIIKDWFTDIEKVKNIWEEIGSHNPDFEEVSEESWHEKEACLWLHGETEVWKANKLEEWLMISPSTSKTATGPARDHYLKWKEFILEEGVYADFSENDLQMPEKNETLVDFILKIAQEIEKGSDLTPFLFKNERCRFLGISALGEGLRPSPQLDLENLFF
jgi:hypothetical protein